MHDTESFEDQRWRTFTQSREFRHDAAIKMVKEGSVLDIGCGDGLLLEMLKKKGIHAEGTDISPEAVARCKEKGFSAMVYDPSKSLPYADNSYDTVMLLDVLEHVYEPLPLLKEAARISRMDVIVSVPNFSSLPARMQVLKGEAPENNRPGKGHVYWFTKKILDTTAHDAGLAYEELRMNTFSIVSRLRIPVSLWPEGFALSFVARFTTSQ